MPDISAALPWHFPPIDALRRWPADRRIAFLHSGRFDPAWSRWSILAQPLGALQFTSDANGIGQSRWVGPPAACPFTGLSNEPFADLRSALIAGRGLWIGYLGYDLGRWVETLPSIAANDRGWPIYELAYCPGYLAHDHASGQWSACGTWAARPNDIPDLTSLPPMPADPPMFHAERLRGVFTRMRFERAVARALDYVAAGDVFQVNLAQRFTADFHGSYPCASRALFAELSGVSPAWYGAYLELAHDSGSGHPPRVIASTSPELFLQLSPDRRVITRPIKGTRPVAVDPGELRRSAKDTAELHMIVDLMRNDLGRICSYGSVRVVEPRRIETHPTIHHATATIEGRLDPSKDLADLLRATMPGGSVTGAPKVRAMQIIDELEPVRRGPYCGCIGALGADRACLSIGIRTMLIESRSVRFGGQAPGRIDFSVGAGIVADSEPHAEYLETLDKAAAICAALGVSPIRK